MHSENCFLTLTYSDEHLPEDYSVNVRTLQLFMKRLREHVGSVRFYGCGEYGDENLRPHYHVLVFGYRFTDLKHWKNSKAGYPIYTSEKLLRIWGFGNAFVGNVSYQSSAYVARYIMKKIGGDQAYEHYLRVHPLTGKLCKVEPEFATGSRRPGLGYTWFQKYKSDVYPSDNVIVDEKKHPVPRYYIKKLAEEEQRKVKLSHALRKAQTKSDFTPERLKVRETVQASKLKQLKRDL